MAPLLAPQAAEKRRTKPNKNNNNMRTLTSLLIGTMILTASHAHATVWRVNNNTNLVQGPGGPGGAGLCSNCFTSLQTAANNAFVLDGDTIHLEPSPVSYGNLTLVKRLVIIGPGYLLGQGTTNNAGLQANNRTAMIRELIFNPGTGGSPGATGSIVTGVVIGDGSNGGGISIRNVNDITLDRNYYWARSIWFDNTGISGFTITRSYFDNAGITTPNGNQVVSNVVVSNNYFSGAIFMDPTYDNVVITHNTFNWSGTHTPYGAEVKNNIFVLGGVAQNDNNIHHNIAAGASSLPAGNGNLNNIGMTSGVFNPANTSHDRKWTLLSSWTYFNGGEGGAQPGMFGGAIPYHPSGIPAIPAVYQLATNPTAIQGTSINVTIGTRSND